MDIFQRLISEIRQQTGIETQLIYNLNGLQEGIAAPTQVIYLSIDSLSLHNSNPDEGYIINYKIHYHMSMATGPFLSTLFRLGLFGISATATIDPYYIDDRTVYYFATVSAIAYMHDEELSIRSQPIRDVVWQSQKEI